MTTYVYRPLCPIPSPVYANTGGNGNTAVVVWGAGILAGSYAIRITKIEYESALLMWRVDSATLHNSSIGPTNAPIKLRQPAATGTVTTAIGTILTTLTGSTYGYTISGTIPGGTFNYLGLSTVGSYVFPSDTIISPGSAFWIGSNLTAVNATQGGTATTAYQGNAVGTSGINFTIPVQQTLAAARVYFEELHLPRSS